MTLPPARPLTLALLSDLHLDFARYTPGTVEADLIVLAGDVCEAGNGSPVRWAQQHFPHQPVLFVPGNHDFYGARHSQVLGRWRREARRSQVHVLDNNVFEMQGVRFLGTPLWSDLASGGITQQAWLLRDVVHRISDFSCMFNHQGKPWTVADMLKENRKAIAFLDTELSREDDVPKVVVTHWAPHLGCTHAEFEGHPLNPFFINHLPQLVNRSWVWLHGHTHQSVDLDVGPVAGRGRILCHPRGYPTERATGTYRPLRVELHPDTLEVVILDD